MMGVQEIPTSELVHDYLESYLDMARCELAVLLPAYKSSEVQHRLDGNRTIVSTILKELNNRNDATLFDRRDLILGKFSI